LQANLQIVSNDPHLDRSEAIRRLVGLGLTVKTKAKKPSAARADHAKELATKAIEKIIDARAPQPVWLGLSKSAPTERLMAARAFVSAQASCRRKNEDIPMSILSAMQYPHWLMVAGAIFVVLGFIGFAFRQNKNVVEPDHGATEMKAKGK
jgi:hypothetical protein